jgi:SNF2 family DNA or RNA helicase
MDDADAIEAAMPTNIMRIRAETPDKERNDILARYATTEDKIGLLLNQASMGKGHTILEGRNMIYYSQRFSVEQRVQSEDRPDRIGQTKSVLVNELYTPDTVEEKVIKVLRDNRELASKIITDKGTLREFIS